MPLAINGKTYYRTAEVCRLIGISKNTLFRWLKEGRFGETEYRDWRGWRLFTPAQLETIKATTSQVNAIGRASRDQVREDNHAVTRERQAFR